MQQEKVLAVLPADHRVEAVYPFREQGHALVAPGFPADRFEVEGKEVPRPQQFRTDGRSRVGRIGAHPFEVPAAMIKTHQAQIFQPVALLLRDRKDDRVRERAVAVAVDDDTAHFIRQGRIIKFRRGSERPVRPQREAAIRIGDALPERNRADMSFAHGPQAHHEAAMSIDHTRLIRMRYNRGVHQRRSGIGVFVAKIGADELAFRLRVVARLEFQGGDHFLETVREHLFRLPVTRLEVLQNTAVLHPRVFR